MPPKTPKQGRFLRACLNPKSRKRMKKKCPTRKQAKKALGVGEKKK